MDLAVSAFSAYQKQNKNKRKKPLENKPEHVPLKRAKKNEDKYRKSGEKNGLSSPGKKAKQTKNQKNKLKKVLTSVSDEEMPTLVPIVIKKTPKKIGVTNGSMKNGFSSPGKKAKQTKNQKNKLKKVLTSESDEEMPTLVPIVIKKTPKKIGVTNKSIFNPVTQGLAIFKWLIDPITPKEFFEKYWEKDVLYVDHSNRNYFEDIFSSEKLDSILREYPLYYTRNVDVVTYENGKKEVLNPEGRAVPSQLWDYYNNGCSVRILNPHTYDQNVHSLISSLQEYFGTMVGTNTYLTPPGSQGFAPHFDDIEAFIIQLEGTKHWKLYKPKGADILARDSSHNFKPEDLDEPFMEVTLKAGDMLYFPRGTIHEGRTSEDAHSLHITVSVYQHTAYVDLLEQLLPIALKKAASENIEYRRGLPLNYLKHVGIVNNKDISKKRELIISKTKSLVESLVNYMDVDLAADNLGRKFMHDAMPPLFSQEEAEHSSKFDGDNMKDGKVYNRVEISTEVKIRLLRYYAVRVVKETETTSKLYYCIDNAKTYHGEEEQWLEIDNSLIPAFEVLHKKYPDFIEVKDLPIEDESAKLQLISDLWERGILVTDGPLPQSTFDSDTDSGSDSSDEFESE